MFRYYSDTDNTLFFLDKEIEAENTVKNMEKHNKNKEEQKDKYGSDYMRIKRNYFNKLSPPLPPHSLKKPLYIRDPNPLNPSAFISIPQQDTKQTNFSKKIPVKLPQENSHFFFSKHLNSQTTDTPSMKIGDIVLKSTSQKKFFSSSPREHEKAIRTPIHQQGKNLNQTTKTINNESSSSNYSPPYGSPSPTDSLFKLSLSPNVMYHSRIGTPKNNS